MADGFGAEPLPARAAEAWDEAARRDPAVEALRAQAERDAALRAERVEAITVGSVIDDALAAVLAAEADGAAWEDIQAFVADYLQGRWGDVASPALVTIFRTNVQTAFNALRYQRMTSDATRPFWRFVAVLDASTSRVCNRCDATTLPASNLWWVTHWPPLHFNCRSTVIALTAAEVEAVGGVTQAPPATVAVADEGFGLTPDLAGDDLEIGP